MLVGVTKEIKAHEIAWGSPPGAVREYMARGHKVPVETGAGNVEKTRS
jgi:alanine dehydrogenase